MKTRVELDPELAAFVRSLAPDPRRRVREGLRGLQRDQGDLKQLEAELSGYVRLRIGSYRVILRYRTERGHRVARCVYAERRAVVYELFAEILRGQA